MQIVKQNNDIVKYLQKDRHVNHNILSYFAYNTDAHVYIYDRIAENGVIVGNEKQNFFFMTTCNRDFMEAFWESLPPGHKVFSGVPKPAADVMTAMIEPVWGGPCKTFVYDGKTQIADSPCGFAIEPLTPGDAEEVDKYYTYRSESSAKRLRESIQIMDSACIRIDGQLASWCLVHAEDGTLGPLFTKPEHRGKGMGEALVRHLIKIIVAKNIIPIAQIAESNTPSLALIEKLGFMGFSHYCTWFGLDKS